MQQIKSLLIIALLFVIPFVKAQEPTIPKFGEIQDVAILQEYTYAKDTTAEAAILFDIGSIRFDERNNALINRRTRIKIYKKSGYNWAKMIIPLYIKDKQSSDLLVDLKAISLNDDNGKIVKKELDKEDIFRKNQNEYYDFIKFAIPDVKEGTIIEFEYTYSSPNVGNLPDWKFQYDIPILWSDFSFYTHPYFTYTMVPTGHVPFFLNEKKSAVMPRTIGASSYKETIYRMAMKDISAFKDEPFITSENDFKSKISFQIAKIEYPNQAAINYMDTWESLNEKLLQNYKIGEYLGDKTFKNEAIELTKDIPETEPLKKAKVVYEFVQKNFKFNGYNTLAVINPPNKLADLKTGSCTDIQLLLCNMLNQVGINAKPVIISKRDHGIIDLNYPLLEKFNYVIVLVTIGKDQYLLDATDKFLVFGMLPALCINGAGLILESEKGKPAQFVLLDQPVYYKHRTNLALNYDKENGQLVLSNNFNLQGYAGLEARNNDIGEENIKESFQLEEISELEVKNLEDNYKPVEIRFKNMMPLNTKETDLFYIKLPYIHEDLLENPFKSSERNFPIDFTFKRDYTYVLTIEIPEGYSIDEKIEPLVCKLPGDLVVFDFKSNLVTEKTLQVIFQFKINTPVIDYILYSQLKDLFHKVVEKVNTTIVLKKI